MIGLRGTNNHVATRQSSERLHLGVLTEDVHSGTITGIVDKCSDRTMATTALDLKKARGHPVRAHVAFPTDRLVQIAATANALGEGITGPLAVVHPVQEVTAGGTEIHV